MKQISMHDDIKTGFILDGSSRRTDQVEAVTQMMEELNLKIDKAILLNIDYETGLKRTLGRRICPNCKKTYNVLTGVNTPKVENMCDDCNVELTLRNDDNEETYKAGYATFMQNCPAVIEYYKNRNMLIELDATGSAEDTLDQLEQRIKEDNND
jgi:adenylate kinase